MSASTKSIKGIGKATEYAVHNSADTSKEAMAGIAAFESLSIPVWPKSVTVEDMPAQLEKIRDLTPVAAGDANAYYQKAIDFLGVDGDQYKRGTTPSDMITRAQVLGDGIISTGDALRPAVDVVKFKAQVNDVIGSVNRLDLLKQVAVNSTSQDVWALITDLIQFDESHKLIGLLSARLLLNQTQRESLDTKLVSITVLTNKAQKLSTGVVRLGGFIGLATVANDSDLASTIRNIRNPLLNQDPMEMRISRKTGETAEAYKTRKGDAELGYNAFVAIMKEMKVHATQYQALDTALIAKIRHQVRRFIHSG